MSDVRTKIAAALLVLGAGIAHADPGLPLASVFAEQRSVTLSPVVFSPRSGEAEQTQTVTGVLQPGARDWVYLPVQVPAGVREIAVDYQYDRPAVPAGERGNALDIGIFDESGIGLGNARGFRGWSGGFRTSFVISASDATPAYVPGPIHEGRWHIILGPYSVAPQGLHWTVTVTLRYGAPGSAFVPSFAPESAPGRGRAWYRGDMHLHTVHSDGRRLPEEVAAGARQAGLDYIVSTEHNTPSAHAIWGRHATPDLLIINGEEITTRNGHYLALGLDRGRWIDWRYRSDDDALAFFTQQIHGANALAVAAHPYCPFVGCSWKFGYGNVDAIEVWNGPWTMDDEVALATWDNLLVASADSRRWVPAVGNSDAHSEPQVIGLPQSVVLASRLERGAILAGVKAGRLWVAESRAVDLSFTASAQGRTAGIGDRLEVDDAETVTVTLNVTGAPGAVVRLFTDEGQIFQTVLPVTGSTSAVTWTTKPRVSRYVRAEVRRLQDNPALPTTMVAFTNPIFLGR
jgi:hypothetical protein